MHKPFSRIEIMLIILICVNVFGIIAKLVGAFYG